MNLYDFRMKCLECRDDLLRLLSGASRVFRPSFILLSDKSLNTVIFGNEHCTPAMWFRDFGKGLCTFTMWFRDFGKGHCTFTMRFRDFGKGHCTFTMRFRDFGKEHCSRTMDFCRFSEPRTITF